MKPPKHAAVKGIGNAREQAPHVEPDQHGSRAQRRAWQKRFGTTAATEPSQQEAGSAMTTETRPPIPMTCADRPTVGGLVIPYINTVLADGGVDFRMPRRTLYRNCLDRFLCQTCGQRLPPTCIVFGGPNQLAGNHFDEPPLCSPCAVYASQACPMVAGRQAHYADRATVSEGHRGKTCPDGCPCDGYDSSIAIQLDGPRAPGGDPAHPWYALHVRTGEWQITVHHADVRCTDGGCTKPHRVEVYNGIRLTAPPRRVTLVSAPGRGRVWEHVTDTAGLLPWAA